MLCKHTLRRRNFHQFVAFTTHTVTKCKRTLRIRLQIISVHCACGYKLLAYTAHAVTKIKEPYLTHLWKKLIFYFSPPVPYQYRLHDKKIIKIQDIKISHLGTFFAPYSFLLISNKFWIGGSVGGSSAIMLLNRTSAVMLLNRTGGVVWALKPPVGSCTKKPTMQIWFIRPCA